MASFLDRINPVKQFQSLFQLSGAEGRARTAEEQARLADITAANLKLPPMTSKTPKPKSLSVPVGGYGGVSDPSQAILQSALNKISAIYNSIPKYTPGAFDEAQARKSVTATTDKYYKSKIEDFLKGVDLQRSQSAENETRTLTQLTAGTDRYLKSEKQQYDIAKEEALSGVVGGGRQLSGFGGRALGQQEAVRGNRLEDFVAGVGEQRENIQAGARQFGERLGLQQQLTIGGYQPGGTFNNLGGEFGRERLLGIEQGVANRRGEFTEEELRRQDQYYKNLAAKQKAATAKIAAQNPSIAQFLGGYF